VTSAVVSTSGRRSELAFWIGNALVCSLALGVLAWILVLREPAGGSEALAFMPAVNAALNSASAACLALGWIAIRRGKRDLHRGLMIGAFVASSLFLCGYVAYHWAHGDTRYPEGAPLRGVYLSILASHVLLSIVALPMVLATFWLSLTKRFVRHRALARWTLPIWLYVSVTGVAVFVMLRTAG
jgi:putative membrane protein